MNECKQKYIEWSSENGNYCGEYDDGRLIGTDAVNEFDGWEAAWSYQQAKIDELKHQKSLQELAINQISQANQEWQRINSDLQKRVDELEDNVNNALSFYNYAKSDVNIGMIKMKQLLRGEE
jgi:uncharacterized coiled-coil protein SlyX